MGPWNSWYNQRASSLRGARARAITPCGGDKSSHGRGCMNGCDASTILDLSLSKFGRAKVRWLLIECVRRLRKELRKSSGGRGRSDGRAISVYPARGKFAIHTVHAEIHCIRLIPSPPSFIFHRSYL